MNYVQSGVALTLIIFLVGCSALQTIPHKQAATSSSSSDEVTSSIKNADLSPRYPSSVDGTANSGESSTPMLYPGAEPSTPPPASPDPASGLRTATSTPVVLRGDGVEMNFEGTDIASTAKTLLGDVLHLNFVIDPRVQGSVTLASVGPIPRKDVLPAFEDVLRMQNAAIVHNGNFIKIVPIGDAAAHASISAGTGESGFGVSIVPLRYVSATSVAKTAENLLARAGAIRTDRARNLLLIQGTASERQAAIDVISTFDVEWLRNQSVGVYPLKSTSPESMIQELEKVFEAGEGGPGQDVIRFQSVARMNAVMVVTKNPDYLKETTRWVQRLDRSDTSGTTVRTYHLKYGSASQVAKVLTQLFSDQRSDDTPINQIAPGKAASESRLDSLDRGGQAGSPVVPSGGTPGSASSNATPIATAFEAFSDQKSSDKSSDANGTRNPQTSEGTALRGALQNVRITADTVNNAVVIYSNQEQYRVVERALRALDRPRLQVAIDATVAEVTLTHELQFGVQYFIGSQSNNAGLFGIAQSAASTALQRAVPGFNLVLGSSAQPNVILNALSNITDVKVLSSPSIVAMDNQPALLQVGDEVPISTGTATILSNSNTPIVNSIQLVNTGVILKVLPHVNSNGTIQLEIDQEVSSVVGTSQPTLTPTISQRRLHSTVSVTSGQTVLLGGLISDNTQKTSSGIPGLSDLKFLGPLFGNLDNTKTRDEIIIFIRPQLIRNGIDARGVTEEFREKLQSMKANARSEVDGEAAAAGAKVNLPAWLSQ
jgi:general secretion pathway protein D